MSIDKVAQSITEQLNEQKKVKVKVALFGQPGAGKSSLINKILGQKAAPVGVETDKTVRADSYEHNGIVLVDLPGYGTKNFPKESYFDKFKISEFDLFLCVSSGKLHQADTEFFHELLRVGKVCIFVVNKHDELWESTSLVWAVARWRSLIQTSCCGRQHSPSKQTRNKRSLVLFSSLPVSGWRLKTLAAAVSDSVVEIAGRVLRGSSLSFGHGLILFSRAVYHRDTWPA